MTRAEAVAFRKLVLAGSAEMDDKAVSTASDVLPRMYYTGELIKGGTRINWNGVVKKAASDLWDTEDNNPDNAPTLWEDIAYKEGYRIIPEVITSTAAFAMGEYGWWKDVLYKSLMDANVWTPDQNPDVWDEV